MKDTAREIKTNGKLPINSEQFGELADSISQIRDNVKSKSQKMAHESVEFAKKYPLHTAIGAGALGFLVGFVTKKLSK